MATGWTRTLADSVRATLCLETGDLAGALGQRHESAVVLGAAARLRGAHDRTDPQVSDLTRRGRAALGEEAFAAAYEKGWELDAQTAVTEVDPARLRR